jgi:hypothetical protein
LIVARPSGCRIEIRLDACLERDANYPWKKSVETILDAADMNVRATVVHYTNLSCVK